MTLFEIGWYSTHLPLVNQVSIGSDSGLSPIRRQAIILTNTELLSTGPIGTNCIDIFNTNTKLPFTKMHMKMSSDKWRTFYPGGDELKWRYGRTCRMAISCVCRYNGQSLIYTWLCMCVWKPHTPHMNICIPKNNYKPTIILAKNSNSTCPITYLIARLIAAVLHNVIIHKWLWQSYGKLQSFCVICECKEIRNNLQTWPRKNILIDVCCMPI